MNESPRCNFADPQCKHEGTERHLSTWYCRAHLPKVKPGNCSHSLAPSGQCAFCGLNLP